MIRTSQSRRMGNHLKKHIENMNESRFSPKPAVLNFWEFYFSGPSTEGTVVTCDFEAEKEETALLHPRHRKAGFREQNGRYLVVFADVRHSGSTYSNWSPVAVSSCSVLPEPLP